MNFNQNQRGWPTPGEIFMRMFRIVFISTVRMPGDPYAAHRAGGWAENFR